jgi:hypothetical protein
MGIESLKSSGLLEPNYREVAEKLKTHNCMLYQNTCIEHTKKDENPIEEPLDLEKEYESAKYTFVYTYEHGEHGKISCFFPPAGKVRMEDLLFKWIS